MNVDLMNVDFMKTATVSPSFAVEPDRVQAVDADAESRHGGGGYPPRGITLARGQGARVEDSAGRSYVDCVAGHGAACLGHGHPGLARALADQASTLISCPASFGSGIRGRLLERLARVTGMQRFFLCNSGAEAVEAAIKYARLTTGRSRIVAAKRGFHGRTMGALSATWEPRYRRPFEPLIPNVDFIPFGDLEAAEQALDGDVAALIVEPIQGEGGVRVPHDEYLPGLRRLCDRYGVLWVVDEVQTGFGRAGYWLAHHHGLAQDGLTQDGPDLAALGKGIAGGFPMGALAIRHGLPAFAPGSHGSTFGGNPLACAASLATLEILENEGLIDRSRQLGRWALDELRRQLGANDSVRDIRGLGLMIGVELRVRSGPVLRQLAEDGILALAAGPTVIRLLPPLVIKEREWQWVIEGLVQRIRGLGAP